MRFPLKMLFLLLLGTTPLFAQSWDALRALKAGDRVIVLDSGGVEHKGTFSTVSDDSITVETRKGQAAIERTRVKRVEVRSNSKRTRNLLIGLGIGVAVGVAIDQSLGTYYRNEIGEGGAARAATYVAPIALFGALGSLPAYRTIYRVR